MYVALLSIIAVELVGIKKLNSSYGIVFMSMGIAGFIGSPIAGKRQIKQYDRNTRQKWVKVGKVGDYW